MTKFFTSFFLLVVPLLLLNYSLSYANNNEATHADNPSVGNVNAKLLADGKSSPNALVKGENPSANEEDEHAHAPGWTVIPFVLLLLMIATGPLFYEHFWHKNYPKISVLLAAIVVSYYIFALHNTHGPVHALIEYVPFISLLSALYIASGGISINIDKRATPRANVAILAIGAVISNIIGTTGASMLLIRPFVRLNKNRIRSYHIIFFIFVISNVGGSLTPIGDPPLFLGFLKGVPFEWTIIHNVLPWALACLLLCLVFYYFDQKNKDSPEDPDEGPVTYSGKVSIEGTKNFLWLGIVVVAIFFDPNVFEWVPSIDYDGAKVSYVKEIIWLMVAFASYRFASKKAISDNDFSFEPIKEVAFLFIGIFGTMMPAIELVGNFASSPEGSKLITHNTLYWGTGSLSGLLDNAPTYINFLTAAMAAKGSDISVMSNVVEFANGGFPDSTLYLKAIAVSAVFFGAMTYIGNGPNFMVKSIAEQIGIKMPSFFGYIIRYSIPVLLPILFIIWLVFFAFQ
ncbi:sodium:proton antiporter [Fulvivirgaceae bacterium BMA12]|uniref:Sodium:proton antiporter n=1 Tax=Agaribacillus aureus TaxID=3051825 RepID=A0ABT8LEG3_9BACT|nr:sodium:proton antiporter [Fulvivirgaceae bacterium BMA12]